MAWLIDNIGALLLGAGLILGLALVTRGNLKGQKTSPIKGCDNCTCGRNGQCENQPE